MFIEKGQEYSTFAGAHVRVRCVVGKTKVIAADLKPPGGTIEIPYEDFQHNYTHTFISQQELDFPKENEGRRIKRIGRNAWDSMEYSK